MIQILKWPPLSEFGNSPYCSVGPSLMPRLWLHPLELAGGWGEKEGGPCERRPLPSRAYDCPQLAQP